MKPISLKGPVENGAVKPVEKPANSGDQETVPVSITIPTGQGHMREAIANIISPANAIADAVPERHSKGE